MPFLVRLLMTSFPTFSLSVCLYIHLWLEDVDFINSCVKSNILPLKNKIYVFRPPCRYKQKNCEINRSSFWKKMGIVFEVMGHPQQSSRIVQVLNSPSLNNEAGNTNPGLKLTNTYLLCSLRLFKFKTEEQINIYWQKTSVTKKLQTEFKAKFLLNMEWLNLVFNNPTQSTNILPFPHLFSSEISRHFDISLATLNLWMGTELTVCSSITRVKS